MSRRIRPLVLVLSAMLAGSALRGQASPIEYEYSGVIDSALPSTDVKPGTLFSGTFTYDPDKTPTGPGTEGIRQYMYGKVPGIPGSGADGSGLTLTVGDYPVLRDPGGVQVAVSELEYAGQFGYKDTDGQPASPYTTVSISTGNIVPGPLQVDLSFSDPTRSVFGSLAPPARLTLGDLPVAKLRVTEFTYPGVATVYTGTIDSLTAHPVPEPGAVACFMLLGGVAAIRGRRRRGA